VDELTLEFLIALGVVLGVFAVVYLTADLISWAETSVAPSLYNQLSGMGVLGTILMYVLGAGAFLGAIAVITLAPIFIAASGEWIYYRVTKRPRINYFEWLYITTQLDIYLRALEGLLELERELKCSERKC